MNLNKFEQIINDSFDNKEKINTGSDKSILNAINETIDLLDQGKIRVANKIDGKWMVNEWCKKSVLLSFRLNSMYLQKGGPDGSLWWDGNCCNCDVQGPKTFDQVEKTYFMSWTLSLKIEGLVVHLCKKTFSIYGLASKTQKVYGKSLAVGARGAFANHFWGEPGPRPVSHPPCSGIAAAPACETGHAPREQRAEED